jgi:hypothetical protein
MADVLLLLKMNCSIFRDQLGDVALRGVLIELVQIVELPSLAVEQVDDDGSEVLQHPDAGVRAFDVVAPNSCFFEEKV